MKKTSYRNLSALIFMYVVMAATVCLSAQYVDLNNDGFTDIVSLSPDSVFVSLNDQSGSFNEQAYPTSGLSVALCAADVDNDNDLDLAVANEGSQPLSVLLNAGDGSFLPADNYGAYYAQGKNICASDLNLDGFPDIVILEESGRFIRFENDGNGIFNDYPDEGYMPGQADAVFSADMDGDTDNDIVTIGNLISIRFNDGSGLFEPNGKFYDIGMPWIKFSGSDFTSDSSVDIHIIGYKWGALYVNMGNGQFEVRSQWSIGNTPNLFEQTGCAIDDFNEDGIPDRVLGFYTCDDFGHCGTGVGISISDGNGEFVGWGGFHFDGIWYSVSGCGDFNGDGILDIIGSGGEYGIMYGLGDGTFQSGNPTDANGDDNHYTIPDRYSLSQNYPNPFNPSTTMAYSLPKRSHVTITIYNVLGQKVATLIDRDETAGSYSVDWNGIDDSGHPVAAGVYLYRLRAGDYIKTEKMLLLK